MPDFSAAGYLIAATFPQHDRELAHYGTEDDQDVALSAAIGPYPAGTTLDVFLAALYGLIQACGTTNPTVASFTASAILSGGIFRADAAIFKTMETGKTFTANWQWGATTSTVTQGSTMTVGAWLLKTFTLTADALLVDNVC